MRMKVIKIKIKKKKLKKIQKIKRLKVAIINKDKEGITVIIGQNKEIIRKEKDKIPESIKNKNKSKEKDKEQDSDKDKNKNKEENVNDKGKDKSLEEIKNWLRKIVKNDIIQSKNNQNRIGVKNTIAVIVVEVKVLVKAI
jgi:hypothetical protein